MTLTFAVVTRAMTHPDAQTLLTAMTEEITALYDLPEGLRGAWTPDMFVPPQGRFVVGYLGTTPAAIGGYRRVTHDVAQIHRVFVQPDLRGQGLAKRLMARLETLAAAAGYRRLRLDTGIRQPSAIRLYEGLGYERVPRFAPYEGDKTVLCYAKALGSSLHLATGRSEDS